MKKLTKLLSVFLIAGAVGTGVAGISACSNKTPEPPEHQHTADTTWHTDANKHWHECTSGDGEKMNEAAHADNNNDGKCDECQYQMTTPSSKLTVAADVTKLIIEGVSTETIDLSTTKTSHTIDKSAIKVYFAKEDNTKAGEVPAANLVLELKDPSNAAATSWEGLKTHGEYKVTAKLVDCEMATGALVDVEDLASTVTVTVNNPYVAGSLAVKESAEAIFTQAQSTTDSMSPTWTYEVTRANGDKEDVPASNVVITGLDTNTPAENAEATITWNGVSGTVTYTITADNTKVSQSYVLNFNNWTAEQQSAINTSSDAAPVVISNVFTVVAGKGAIANENTEGDGLFYNTRLKFGGHSNAKELDKQRYIKVTAADAGKLTVYAYSNTGTAPADGAAPNVCETRKLAVYGSRTAANGTDTSVYGDPVGKSQTTYEKYISIHTFDLPAAGEYYIVAEGGDICFTYVKLDMLRTAGDGIEKVDAPAGTDEIAKISVSTATEGYKQAFTLGETFSVSEEYTVKGIVANNVTGVVASNGAITEGISYWLGDTQLTPGTSTMDVLGNNTITVKVGSLSATYTVVVNSAVDGITGIKASDTLANKQVDTADGTIALTKNDIKVELVGENAGASITSSTVKVDGVELTDTINLTAGEHTIEVTAKVEAGTANTTLTDTFTITITVKPTEGSLENVVVGSSIVSPHTGNIVTTTDLVNNANGKIFITAGAEADKKHVVIDANNKSIDGKDFTHRIKLGGAGSVDYRSMGIEVKDAATIVIYAMSSSKDAGAERDVQLLNADGTAATATGTLDGAAMGKVEGANIHKITYTVTAAGTFYFGSVTGGLNVYGVEIIYS